MAGVEDLKRAIADVELKRGTVLFVDQDAVDVTALGSLEMDIDFLVSIVPIACDGRPVRECIALVSTDLLEEILRERKREG